MRIPRLKRRRREFAWSMTLATLNPLSNGTGWVLITNGGTFLCHKPTDFETVKAKCIEYMRTQAATEHPWVEDATFNILYFDFRPNKVTRRNAGFQFVRPEVPAEVEEPTEPEAVDA